MNMRKYFTVLVLSFLTFSFVHAQGLSPVFSSPYPHPGDTVVVSLPSGSPGIASATFNGASVPFFPYKTGERVIFGVPAKTVPGSYVFKINFVSGDPYSKTIRVIKK